MNARVFAIIPAFQRPQLLARALQSLEGQGPSLARVIVVNNSSDAETARIAAASPLPTRVLDFGCNLGTAGGISAGMHEMLQDAEATHAFVMDDDACATPGALAAMLRTAEAHEADAVAPLITDETGRVRWFPGPLAQPAWDVVRSSPTPAEFLQRCGPVAPRWNWAIWASLLISRRAIVAVGYPRIDLWSQFTDLEYTLRLSARFKCVLAADAVCAHLPPLVEIGSDRAKLFWALQHGDYAAVRLRHGWRFLRHLPGQQMRYLQHYRWRPHAWWDVARAFVGGAVLGRTAGLSVHAAEVQRAAAFLPAASERVAGD